MVVLCNRAEVLTAIDALHAGLQVTLLGLALHGLGQRPLSPFVPPSDRRATSQQSYQPQQLQGLQIPIVEHQTRITHAGTSTQEAVRNPVVGFPTGAIGVSNSTLDRNALITEFNSLPSGIRSPINIERLEYYLRDHPDRNVVNYVVNGFRNGFDIGFQGEVHETRPRNLLSALRNPQPVFAAVVKELQRGHTAGPFAVPPLSPLHCSPLGAVPKKDGSFRIILDLSSPRGDSVNEGISRDDFSVRYTLFDEAIELVRQLGEGCIFG